MKKISLKNLNLKEVDQLSREQLKNVLGGYTGGSGTDVNEPTTPSYEDDCIMCETLDEANYKSCWFHRTGSAQNKCERVYPGRPVAVYFTTCSNPAYSCAMN